MDKVVHFEIPADNVPRAKKFYSSAFGWNVSDVSGMKYTMVSTVETDERHIPKSPGAINGGMLQRQGPITSPVITIQVADVDAALKKLEKAGGKVIRGKLAVGDMGFAAYFKDTEGNVLGLWQPR
ncbi:VOC family protein [Candidatus Woesearchaeota archaeon]|nr:VOC family protein [Candidatus Woesearchaeota archaeon]